MNATITLRDYQEKCVQHLRKAFVTFRKICFVLPTGGGKTVLFSYMAHGAMSRGKRVLILAHRDELLDQISGTLGMFDVPHSVLRAGTAFTPDRVNVAQVFTLVLRPHLKIDPDFIVIDEGHHAVAGSWERILARYPKAHVLLVTATPERLDGKGLGDIAEVLVEGPTVAELTQAGYLAPARYYSWPVPIDMSKAKKRMGDYTQDVLEEFAGNVKLMGDAVRHYTDLAPGKLACVFCANVAHAEAMAEKFREAGYKAQCLKGGMDPKVRRAIVASFREGTTQVLTSCNLISEGFDLPDIEVGILLRPTASLSLYLQQIGRCLRPGKECALIIDHVGNVLRHGLADDPREWSLEGRKKKNAGNECPVKTCKACFACIPISVRKCPYCGEEIPITIREIKEDPNVKLVEIGKRKFEAKNIILMALAHEGRRRQMELPGIWAKKMMRDADEQTVYDALLRLPRMSELGAKALLRKHKA